jgi:hypothetical protein
MANDGFDSTVPKRRGLTAELARQKYGRDDQAEPPETYLMRIEREEDQWRAVVSYVVSSDNVVIARLQDAGKLAVVGRACKSIRKHATDLDK